MGPSPPSADLRAPMRLQPMHAYVAVAGVSGGGKGVAILFVGAGGRLLQRTRQVRPEATGDLAAFRGIITALWTARRLGSRRIVVHSDTPGVVARINGDRDVEPELVGPYLEVRALMHAYRSARVEPDQAGQQTLEWAPAPTYRTAPGETG